MSQLRRSRPLLPLGFALLVTSLAAAQERDSRASPSWGGTDRVLNHIGSHEFVPTASDITYGTASGIYSTLPSGSFEAALHLPSGAALTYLELDYCDFDPALNVTLSLQICTFLGSCLTHISLSSATGFSGCNYVTADLTPLNIVINNNTHYYELFAGTQSGNTNNQIVGAYVGYKLQVSPAPATATFPNDVPTDHPFFQFVEALARAGITAGCSPGSFCPDAPLTRGQMAVFLSVALGLHFPN